MMRAAMFGVASMGAALVGCTTFKPPEITYDAESPAVLQAEPPKPAEIVEVPRPSSLSSTMRARHTRSADLRRGQSESWCRRCRG